MPPKKAPAKPTTPLTIGLDIGYGVTKALTSDATITFPSVFGHARSIQFHSADLSAKYPAEHITDFEGDWFVGDLALSQIPTGELVRLRGRAANDSQLGNVSRLRLAKVAIAKLLAGCKTQDAVHIVIATGLPCDHMADADALRASLMGVHPIKTDSTDFTAHVVDVMVMPQPYGTIYSKTLLSNGQINTKHTAMRTGVLDIGTYTIDVALDEDGEYIDAESGSTESGVFTAHERIAAALERDYRQKMPYKVVEETLRTGRVKIAGEWVSYQREVEAALEPLRSATMALLLDKFKNGANVDVIYVSGGGADLVFRDVIATYPQAQRVQSAQVANAQGYLNYARMMESE